MSVIARYAIVTLCPLGLLFLAALGPVAQRDTFALAALVWLTLVAAVLDWLLAPPKGPEDRTGDATGVAAERLSLLLGAGHLVLLPTVLIALAGPGLDLGGKAALFFATASFLGQVSHPNAHELIHSRARMARMLGALVYTSMGFGHHVSAHRRVHHAHVGTEKDPNTPLPGESFWSYMPRAWADSFQAGLAAEEDRLERAGRSVRSWRNPYYVWVGGEALMLVAAVALAGPVGILAYLGFILLSGLQILLSDYVQHYGLQRLELPDGRTEPVGPHHSWNAPRGFSSYLMLNAPSHSEHHLHPDRSYESLGAPREADPKPPMLPYSLPIMAMLATIPPLWHRVMDRRALKVMEAAEQRIFEANLARIDGGPTGDDTPEDETINAAPAPELPKRQVNSMQMRRDLSPLPQMEADDDAILAKVECLVERVEAAAEDAPTNDPDDDGANLSLAERAARGLARTATKSTSRPRVTSRPWHHDEDAEKVPSKRLRLPVRSSRRIAQQDP